MLALIVREPWASMIVNGAKTWEIRARDTRVRGRILIIRGGSGLVIGEVTLADSVRVSKRLLNANTKAHRVPPQELRKFLAQKSYRRPFVWVFQRAVRYRRPRRYRHPNGAVIWVRV